MNYSLTKTSDYGEYDYEDQDGCHWNDPKEWFLLGVLGGCGCGSSETIQEMAFQVLEYFALPHKNRNNCMYDNISLEILANWMNTKDLLEHGCSINSGWLSDTGKEIYNIITQLYNALQ